MEGGGEITTLLMLLFSKSQILDRDYGYVEKLCLTEREREKDNKSSQKEKILNKNFNCT